jgi:predicted adenine nucleotide alpha hydrolase (AANH) superfamily ATPase
MIRSLAEESARRHGIPFQYEDYRVGWVAGQNEARELGIYRQVYCGCIYSERDRFYKPKSAKVTSTSVPIR